MQLRDDGETRESSDKRNREGGGWSRRASGKRELEDEQITPIRRVDNKW